MIFKREWVTDLFRTKRALDCRPLQHRDGKEMQYKVGGVYPVQPGRFKPHVCHVRVESLEPTVVGALRSEGLWELPAAWADSLPVAVMELRLVPRRTIQAAGLNCCAEFVA